MLVMATISGKISTSEVFTHSHWFEDDVATGLGAFAAQAVTFAGALTDSGHRAYYTAGIVWDGLRLDEFDPLTGAQLDSITPSFGPAAGTGTSSGVRCMPFQTATCVSLRSTTATRSGRGRFYLPPPGVDTLNTGTNGSYSTAFVSQVATSVSNAYGGITTATCRGVVVSKVGGAPWVLRDITLIDIGNIPDTQRRRRNRLVETRSSVAIS